LKEYEKYLPMIRDAFEKGNVRADHLAYLEDRIAGTLKRIRSG